jgi:CheY-like chemotaxis protein
MDGGAVRVRLLLVDDNEEFLRAESAWLGVQPGFEVVGTARSGEAGLEAVRSLRPDIVLMDLAMPGMSGFEAIRVLKLLPSPPAVIAVSLHDSQVVRSEAAMAGADAFVPKARLSTLLVPALRGVQDAAHPATGDREQPAEAGPQELRSKCETQGSVPPLPATGGGYRDVNARPGSRILAVVAAWWSNSARSRARRAETAAAPGWLPRSAR